MRKSFFILAAAAVLAATFALGALVGYERAPEIRKIAGVLNGQAPAEQFEEVDFNPFWKTWRLVEEKYAAPDGIDRQKIVWGAIQGALKSLGDPYTVFFPPVEKKIFESEVRGDFEGVGMEIAVKKGVLTVVAPLKGTPALRGGVKPGDKILKIDDKESADMSAEEAVELIRGPKGSTVKLLIFSQDTDAPREVSLVRDVIQIPVIDTEQKDGGVFVIKLHNFSERSPFEFRMALREFILSGSDKMIIDLRNNPGGYLEAAVDIASWFLDTGEVVVREKFKSGEERLYRSKGYDPFKNLKLAVLVNQGSASASEILAGTLKDHGKAAIIGERTFGKGSVQELVPVTPETSVKITIARWLTPNGQSFSEVGLQPDVEIKNTKEDDEKGRDAVMEKALEIL
ncbi:MAG: S41 family peptidase [bacterium]|nr:S41 family peptidase [bacterium]